MAVQGNVVDVRSGRDGYIDVRIEVSKRDLEVVGLVLRYRDENEPLEYWLDIVQEDSPVNYAIDARFFPSDFKLRQTYWDLFVIVRQQGHVDELPCKCSKAVKRKLTYSNVQAVLPDGMVIFPYIARANTFAFIYREKTDHDSWSTRAKEAAAFCAYRSTAPYWKKHPVWLVFEKYSWRAQDNGFYFFKYCMEHLPQEERKHIFYVIDDASPDVERLAPYKDNVISFMSFKHMLFAMGADLFVGSESVSHLFAWRYKASKVKQVLAQKDIMFLQHGVMGIKCVDELFGIAGLHPMAYFLTSATREHDIIVDNFGYAQSTAPVLGLARWDALQDNSTPDAPSILVMPTWRAWLEGLDAAEFQASEYYTAYISLLQDSRLAELLEKHDAVLNFYIHPKFSSYIDTFSVSSPRIRLVSENDRPMNELIMECSALITDYSSVCWDVLYLNKPVCYYQFDQERFLASTGSYIDVNHDLPGPVCTDLDTLVSELGRMLALGCPITDAYERRLLDWGLLQEGNNCERTYDYLVERPPCPSKTPIVRKTAMDKAIDKLPRPVRDKAFPERGARVRYVDALKTTQVDERAILLESRHGTAFEGNMFYIAHELLSDPRYEEFKIFVPAARDRMALVKSQVGCLPQGQRVQIVTYNTTAYFEALATSKYLMNDTSFLHVFYKRPEQVYLNTWHGTPLKYLGRNVADEAVRMGNVHRNLLTADYLLFPNEHTADVMCESYMLEGQCTAENLLCGYPRNAILLNDEHRSLVRSRLGLSNTKVYAFMPTYRGLNGSLHMDHFALTREHLEYWDNALAFDELMFVNLHPFMAEALDCAGLKRVRMFPPSMPAYDFLAACDGLITDYSSVMFDYACTARPLVLFTYDIEEYAQDRGMYFDIEQTSFPSVRTVEEVLPALRSFVSGCYEDMRRKFCAYDSADAIKRLLDYVIWHKGELATHPFPCHDQRERLLVDVNGLCPQRVPELLERYFDDPGLTKRHYYVTFDRTNDGGDELLQACGHDVDYFAIGGTQRLDMAERRLVKKWREGTGEDTDAFWRDFAPALAREWQRRFGTARFERVVMLGAYDENSALLYASANVPFTIVSSQTYCNGIRTEGPTDRATLLLRDARFGHAPRWLEAERVPLNVDNAVRCMQVGMRVDASRNGALTVHTQLRLKFLEPQLLEDLVIGIGQLRIQPRIHPLGGKRELQTDTHWFQMSFTVSPEDLERVEGEEQVLLLFDHNEQLSGRAPVYYSMVRRGYRSMRSRSRVKVQGRGYAYFKQGYDRNLALYVGKRQN